MKYTEEEVLQYVREEDVKFIRLTFCDVTGHQMNIAIMPEELPRAFRTGIAIDGSAVPGFGGQVHTDLVLHPDPATLHLLPWRPEHGKVVRLYCTLTLPSGDPFPCDTRGLLLQAAAEAERAGCHFYFGAKQDLYLFLLDDAGYPTDIPYDRAGYMDLAPEDRGENIRREINLILEQLGIQPERSHHEEGPGQNKISFRYSDVLTAADNVMTFRTVARTIAHRNGLYADFGAKPLENEPGNGFHITVSVRTDDHSDVLGPVMAGILEKTCDMTAFLDPTVSSYARLGKQKAPGFVSWSAGNWSQLIRIPDDGGKNRRGELRSPDPTANPYLAFALLIHAGLYGIEQGLRLPDAADLDLMTAGADIQARFRKLPEDLSAALQLAAGSAFIREHVPEEILAVYRSRL